MGLCQGKHKEAIDNRECLDARDLRSKWILPKGEQSASGNVCCTDVTHVKPVMGNRFR